MMDIIFEMAGWCKTVGDKFFATIGFDVETPEGIIAIAVGAVVLNLAGIFFGKMADKFNDK